VATITPQIDHLTGTWKHYIGGKAVDSLDGATFESTNPANGDVIATVAAASLADVDLAVAAARKALDGPWGDMKPLERHRLLHRFGQLVEEHFEELSILESMDMGRPIVQSRATKYRALGLLDFYAAQALNLDGRVVGNSLPDDDYFTYTVRQPVGVVAGILAWNSPIGASMWKIGPVLCTGCTLVLKPAQQAPLVTTRLVQLLHEVGVPDGVVNLLNGSGRTIGAALAAHPGVDKVAFTGSTDTGRAIIQASAGNLRRVTVELGGKSPDIVFNDADLDLAVPGAAQATFANTGQNCSAGTRLFVQSGVYDEVVERIADLTRGLVIGNGLDERTQIGPVVSQSQLDTVLGYIDAGSQEGAEVVAGGRRSTAPGHDAGFFVEPTVFANVRDEMKIAREEIFGPVISVLKFDTIDEVVARSNANEYGLASGVWTQNITTAHKVAAKLQAGTVWVNCYQVMEPALPFGGFKASGYGRESGTEQLDEYTATKSVCIRLR
jgi:aldehyde dehydrogenase (NAD+)